MAEPEAEVRRMRELSCSGLWNVHSLQGTVCLIQQETKGTKLLVDEGELSTWYGICQ
jgi:hypothetical protein